MTNLNDTTVDLGTMLSTLTTSLMSADLATFIIMYRQYGPAPAAASETQSLVQAAVSLVTTGKTSAASTTQTGVLSSFTVDTTKAAKTQITSLYSLINAQVAVSTPDPKDPKKMVTTTYSSPLSDPTQQATLLPLLFQYATVFPATEIPARVNMNTAPFEVVSALPYLATGDRACSPSWEPRPQYSSSDTPDPIYQTPAWLITKAAVSPTTLAKLEPYITARTQVYRVQSLGYFDPAKGPVGAHRGGH